MSTLFPKIFNIINTLNGSYSDDTGLWESGNEVLGTFKGSIQPVTSKEFQSLEMGRADIGTIKVYSDTQLIVSADGGDNTGTIILYNNKRYEVIREDTYTSDLINHFKYFAELRIEVVV